MVLSKTAKTETVFESFYGTNIAGSQVATSEMNEEQVSSHFSAAIFSEFDPLMPCRTRCLRRTRIATSRMNVSALILIS
jgi:hypothetical protein